VKSKDRGKLFRLLSQLRPRIRPLDTDTRRKTEYHTAGYNKGNFLCIFLYTN